MDNARPSEPSPDLSRKVLDLVVKLVVVGLLAYWCFRIVLPFLIPIAWGIILAVALHPVYLGLEKLLGGRRKFAATLMVLACLTLLTVPVVLLSDSVLGGARALSSRIENGGEGELGVPPAPESVAGWPVIGPQVYAAWNEAATSLEAFLRPFRPQLLAFGKWLVGLARGAAFAVILTAIAVVIAAVFLVRREAATKVALQIGEKLGGERGAETVRLAGTAIGTVAKGVVGVAAIQAALAAVGFVVVGIPGAGLWALLVLVLAVAQLPAILVLGPAILYLVASDASTTVVVLFTLWSLVVTASDAILKPLLMGRGSELPVLVILIGAIGGLLLHGLIGLFVGAVVLAVVYRLFGTWMQDDTAPDTANA